MIDCKKAQSLANGYIDDALSEADCSAYEEHISCCESCHEEYDMLKRMVGDMNHMAAALPKDFSRKLHTALVSEQLKDNKKERKFAFPYYRTASVVMAAFVIAIVGKFGIYDVYNKVNTDNANMVKEIVNTEKEIKTGTDTVETQKPVVITEKKASVKTPPATYKTVAQAPEVAEEPVQIAEETVAPVSEMLAKPQAEVTEEIVSDENIAIMRMVEEEIAPASAEDGEEAPESVNDTAEIIPPASTEPVPAYVEIHASGEGSMIMIKKYLLTFLDSSQITEQDGKIMVTVKDTEYYGVMDRLKQNEYVKSVTDGMSFNGEVQIIIG